MNRRSLFSKVALLGLVPFVPKKLFAVPEINGQSSPGPTRSQPTQPPLDVRTPEQVFEDEIAMEVKNALNQHDMTGAQYWRGTHYLSPEAFIRFYEELERRGELVLKTVTVVDPVYKHVSYRRELIVYRGQGFTCPSVRVPYVTGKAFI